MVSLCFNISTGGFDKSSVLTLTNCGWSTPSAITAAFGLWNKLANPKTNQLRVSQGLPRRRRGILVRASMRKPLLLALFTLSTPVALDSLTNLPSCLVPALAGSTPCQKRQWQRAQAANLSRTGVLPTKLKNSSLAMAPSAVATTVTRPCTPVATGAGNATGNIKAGQRSSTPLLATAPTRS
ncbi:hypothetical protein Q5H92_00015 [Hymenobacter sp. M29]|uniref:Uncharacterized protein n=1 Tax=Hymenobacter mellowenesis TaxID=3063995 RepID=A0ABT9A4E6_9BACT|nr:hypothetical protein [Hymenobacter sp. M29]MDO7844722.1 hypothetical protein [Hymenobacter sp. M29]